VAGTDVSGKSRQEIVATIEERAVAVASPWWYFPVRKPAASEKYGMRPMSCLAATSPRFPGPSTSPRWRRL